MRDQRTPCDNPVPEGYLLRPNIAETRNKNERAPVAGTQVAASGAAPDPQGPPFSKLTDLCVISCEGTGFNFSQA